MGVASKIFGALTRAAEWNLPYTIPGSATVIIRGCPNSVDFYLSVQRDIVKEVLTERGIRRGTSKWLHSAVSRPSLVRHQSQ